MCVCEGGCCGGSCAPLEAAGSAGGEREDSNSCGRHAVLETAVEGLTLRSSCRPCCRFACFCAPACSTIGQARSALASGIGGCLCRLTKLAACVCACPAILPLQAQLEAVSKERGNLLDEVHRLREESAEARHQLKRTQQQLAAAQQTAAAAAARQQQQPNGEAGGGEGQGDAATGQAVAAAAAAAAEQELREAQRQHAAELSRLEAELLLVQRQNAELQQRLRAAEAAAAAAARSGGAAPGEREAAVTRAATAGAATPQAGGIDGAGQAAEPVAAGGAASPSGPAVSAAISALAIQEAGAASTAAQQQGQQVQGGLPPELAALLPAALYAGPTADSSADGLPNGQAVLQLSSSIHLLLDALEQEKRQLLAALNAKQVRVSQTEPRLLRCGTCLRTNRHAHIDRQAQAPSRRCTSRIRRVPHCPRVAGRPANPAIHSSSSLQSMSTTQLLMPLFECDTSSSALPAALPSLSAGGA